MKPAISASCSLIPLFCLIACLGLAGCESLQRKFVRKPKHPRSRENPIVVFTDYSKAMTPIEKYRKHYLMFEYWNADLMEALQTPSFGSGLSPKRITRSSSEALAEIKIIEGMLSKDFAKRLEPLIEERAKIDKDIRAKRLGPSNIQTYRRRLERQTRIIHREFSWKDVEDTGIRP